MIFGARNEIIAFQLIVEADQNGIERLTVALPQLTQKGGHAKISYAAPAADPTNYVGRPIQIFSVDYMNVEVPSHADWVYKPGSPAAPRKTTGGRTGSHGPPNARAPGAGVSHCVLA